jgi:hypothetical protein
MNFRKIDHDQIPGIRNDRSLTLILIPADDRNDSRFAADRGGKDEIVKAFKPDTDLLLLAWTGRYKTDIFEVTKADLDACYLRD